MGQLRRQAWLTGTARGAFSGTRTGRLVGAAVLAWISVACSNGPVQGAAAVEHAPGLALAAYHHSGPGPASVPPGSDLIAAQVDVSGGNLKITWTADGPPIGPVDHSGLVWGIYLFGPDGGHPIAAVSVVYKRSVSQAAGAPQPWAWVCRPEAAGDRGARSSSFLAGPGFAPWTNVPSAPNPTAQLQPLASGTADDCTQNPAVPARVTGSTVEAVLPLSDVPTLPTSFRWVATAQWQGWLVLLPAQPSTWSGWPPNTEGLPGPLTQGRAAGSPAGVPVLHRPGSSRVADPRNAQAPPTRAGPALPGAQPQSASSSHKRIHRKGRNSPKTRLTTGAHPKLLQHRRRAVPPGSRLITTSGLDQLEPRVSRTRCGPGLRVTWK